MRSSAVRLPAQHETIEGGGTGTWRGDGEMLSGQGAGPSSDSLSPLTVLLVVPTLDSGAADQTVVDIVGILRAAGHRAVVASRGGRKVASVESLGAEHVSIDVASINPVVMLFNVRRLVRLIRRSGAQVVHAHGRAAAWCGYLAAGLTSRPFVTTWHKGFREQNPFKRLYNSVMVRGDRVVAVSDQIADLVHERYGTAWEQIEVIPCGIDAVGFDPGAVTPDRIDAARRSFGVGERTKVILVAGRMLRRKGHHVMIAAVQRLKALGVKDFVCVVAGEDAGSRYAGELWDQVLASDTADMVRLVGYLDDMPAAYAASTVVVSGAIQHEGLQRSILEAQAMGRPVIASDLGAGAEVVLAPPSVPEDRMTGLRFPAGNAAALTAALVRLFSMPEGDRAAMGARGRAWVTSNFSPEAVAERTLALYRKTVQVGADHVH
jgi:glycosyltransferase involved in cell wall biosynthesis